MTYVCIGVDCACSLNCSLICETSDGESETLTASEGTPEGIDAPLGADTLTGFGVFTARISFTFFKPVAKVKPAVMKDNGGGADASAVFTALYVSIVAVVTPATFDAAEPSANSPK